MTTSLLENFELPSGPHRPAQFNTSVPHKYHTLSAPKILQFNTQIPSVPHTRQFHTKNSSVQRTPQFHTAYIELFLSEGCVELRGFWCGTEGFLVWN